MVIREEDAYSSNPPSFPSPSGDESRKRLNVHFPEVRFSPKVRFSPRWDFPQGETLRPLLVLPDQLTFDQLVHSIVLDAYDKIIMTPFHLDDLSWFQRNQEDLCHVREFVPEGEESLGEEYRHLQVGPQILLRLDWSVPFPLPVLYWYVSGAAPPDEGGLGNFL